jgi:hypothetical protein
VKRIALGVGVLLILLFVVAQLVLPRVAERYVRSEVRKNGGVVESVDVAAFPALKLVLRHADRVTLKLKSATLGVGDLADELERTKDVERLDATVARMDLGPLKLNTLELHKRGDRLTGEASVASSDLSAALPAGVGVDSVEADDQGLVLQARVGPLSARARLSADEGALRIAPEGLLGGLATVTVFDDPRVYVSAVGAEQRPDGFTLTADGRLF